MTTTQDSLIGLTGTVIVAGVALKVADKLFGSVKKSKSRDKIKFI